MYVISLLMVISIISAIGLLMVAENKKIHSLQSIPISELDYLYTYKRLLLRMVEMEKEMIMHEKALTGYIENKMRATDRTFTPVILQKELAEVNTKLKDLIEIYAFGEVSLSTVSFELDMLENRINNISCLMAA